MKKYLVLLALTLSLLISGCTPKTVYIETPCVEMQTWEVEPLDTNLTYEVFNEDG